MAPRQGTAPRGVRIHWGEYLRPISSPSTLSGAICATLPSRPGPRLGPWAVGAAWGQTINQPQPGAGLYKWAAPPPSSPPSKGPKFAAFCDVRKSVGSPPSRSASLLTPGATRIIAAEDGFISSALVNQRASIFRAVSKGHHAATLIGPPVQEGLWRRGLDPFPSGPAIIAFARRRSENPGAC